MCACVMVVMGGGRLGRSRRGKGALLTGRCRRTRATERGGRITAASKTHVPNGGWNGLGWGGVSAGPQSLLCLQSVGKQRQRPALTTDCLTRDNHGRHGALEADGLVDQHLGKEEDEGDEEGEEGGGWRSRGQRGVEGHTRYRGRG